MIQTKREYAVSLGLATMGRGRLSREAHAAIAKAEAEGMVFSDTKPVVNTPSATKPVKPVSNEGAGMIGEIVQLWPNDALFEGVDSHGKKHVVNARQVCRNSGYSMTSCPCGREHEVLVASLEHIKVTPKGR